MMDAETPTPHPVRSTRSKAEQINDPNQRWRVSLWAIDAYDGLADRLFFELVTGPKEYRRAVAACRRMARGSWWDRRTTVETVAL